MRCASGRACRSARHTLLHPQHLQNLVCDDGAEEGLAQRLKVHVGGQLQGARLVQGPALANDGLHVSHTGETCCALNLMVFSRGGFYATTNIKTSVIDAAPCMQPSSLTDHRSLMVTASPKAFLMAATATALYSTASWYERP